MEPQSDTNQINKVTNHIKTLQTSTEFMEASETQARCESVKSFKKWGINNAHDGIEDEVLFEQGKSLDNKNSNDQCKSSDKDFREFYH
jgi:hypothetical protein